MNPSEVSGRFVDAATMFGSESVSAVPALTGRMDAVVAPATDDIVFQGLCLLLLFFIGVLLRYRYELRELLGGLVRSFSADFESGRKLTALTGGFLNAAAVTGILAMAIVAVKYLPLWMPEVPFVEPQWLTAAAAVAVVAASGVVILCERVMLSVIGLVAGSRDFAESVIYVKRACFAVVSLALSPVVLISALSADDDLRWFYFIVAECVVLTIFFLKETFVLFIRKKIPIFQWFLYLCTVEAFPLTLICASIARFR